MQHTDQPVARIRAIVQAFSLTLDEGDSRVLATATAQLHRDGGVDMETDIALSGIADTVERNAKADLNLQAIEAAVYRHREEVREWLADPCYDLESQARADADIPHLRAFAHVALEAGSPNVANALYVLRLEKRVADLEKHRAEMADAMTHEAPEPMSFSPRLGG